MPPTNLDHNSQLVSSNLPWQGEELHNYSLAKHTTWHIGGPAEIFYTPTSVDDLAIYISCAPKDIPLTLIGLGSNLLVRDGGVRGVVVSTKNLNQLKFIAPNMVYAEAGVTCAKLAKFCNKNNLSGGEFFAGIPGTIGGALAMNAGAFGGETWESVIEVTTLDRNGALHKRLPEAYDISYRTAKPLIASSQPEIFMAACFKFMPATTDSAEKIKKLLQERNQKQPIGTRNCGSVFRNPPGDYAARLIEACGLKGYRQGGALISLKHANFIINDSDAKSTDIEKLIELIQVTVLHKFNIKLIPEVRIIGEPRSGSQ